MKRDRLHAGFINEHRIHLKMKLILWTSVHFLITQPGTDWLNRHDGYRIDDTSLLFTADTDGGRRDLRGTYGLFKSQKTLEPPGINEPEKIRYYHMDSAGIEEFELATFEFYGSEGSEGKLRHFF